MTEVKISATAYSIQLAKPSQRYGQLALLPIYHTEQYALVRVSLAGIPSDATITSAVMTFKQGASASGDHTLVMYRVTSQWSSTVTWSTRPSNSATVTDSIAKTDPAAGSVWAFDVTHPIQAAVAGTYSNFGFVIKKTEDSRLKLLGTPAGSGSPYLAIEYTVKPDRPTNLHPSSGAVSTASPTLTFDSDDDIISLQVQIDPDASSSSPEFDSGEVSASAGLLDLDDTAYAGLDDGDTTSWRARQKSAGGWSPWSTWAVFSRVNYDTLTITSPASGIVEDGTPPVEWTFSGTQTAWRARLYSSDGSILDDSGRTNGTATDWTPEFGFTEDEEEGYVRVYVWDDVDREATPGDPGRVTVKKDLTFNLDPTVDPVDTLVLSQGGPAPGVRITGTRATGTPDQLRVFVNGKQTKVFDGVDVFTGANYSFSDMSAPMNVPATYRVAPVVDGKVAKGGPTVTFTPECVGIWLFDYDDVTDRVAIWGNEDQDQSQPELSVVHTPISDGDGSVQVARRRLVRMPPQGAIAGTITDGLGEDAGDTEALLKRWATYDAGHKFRLFLGNHRYKCIIGDLNFSESPATNGHQRVLNVSFNWWVQK